jgi:hypothetical protein
MTSILESARERFAAQVCERPRCKVGQRNQEQWIKRGRSGDRRRKGTNGRISTRGQVSRKKKVNKCACSYNEYILILTKFTYLIYSTHPLKTTIKQLNLKEFLMG